MSPENELFLTRDTRACKHCGLTFPIAFTALEILAGRHTPRLKAYIEAHEELCGKNILKKPKK